MAPSLLISAAWLGVSLALMLVSPARAEERFDFHLPCATGPAHSCQWSNLDGRDLTGKDLSDSNYKSIHLRSANLHGENLTRINLQTAGISRSDFSNATLANASLFAANAEYADLRGARKSATTWLIGTRLGSAVWVDGRVCAPGSIGHCD